MKPATVGAGLALAALLAACASPPRTPHPAPPAPLLLLGEVHDNATQPAQRRQRLQAVLDGGARPALLMEQFNREQQADIDALLAGVPATGGRSPAQAQALADQLQALGGGAQAGWDWALYRPLLDLAVQHGLPLVAANVSRADARRVMQQGLAPLGFDARVPADILEAQAAAIEASHCGQVPAVTARRMALAQVARDQHMARLLAAQAGRGAVLLAGNGHVRKDIGVPRWLPPALQAQARAIGFLETGVDPPDRQPYDEVVSSPPQARGDPCAGFGQGGGQPTRP